jgi:rSAM/selenodomain-associated transferase 1
MIEFVIMAISEALIVFAKQPEPGKTKTRLAPPLNAETAARLYGCFLADTLETARQIQGIERIIAYDDPQAEPYFAVLAPDFRHFAQTGAGLGKRMHNALACIFSAGYRRAVIVGSDLPHLPAQTIEQGFQSLRQGAEVVLGPSADGGYYLVGLTRPQPQLFDLPMSTSQVLHLTLERAKRLSLKLALLEKNFDIDTAQDLEKLSQLLRDHPDIPAESTRQLLAKIL